MKLTMSTKKIYIYIMYIYVYIYNNKIYIQQNHISYLYHIAYF